MNSKLYNQVVARWPRRKLTRDRFLRLEICDADLETLEDNVLTLQTRVEGTYPNMTHFKGLKWPMTTAILAGVHLYTLQAAADELQVAHTSLNRRAEEIPHFQNLSDRKMFLIGDIAEARKKFAKAPAVRQKYPKEVVWVKCECCGKRHREYKEVRNEDES